MADDPAVPQPMTGEPAPTRGGTIWPGLGLALAAALLALGINLLVPVLSALLLAILLGAGLGSTVGVPAACAPGTAVAAKRLLRIGIVLLGLQLSLTDIAGLGWGSAVVVVLVVAGGIVGTELIGRALGVKPALRLLIGCGFSICGAAAVAAVDDVIEDKDEEDAVTALALVVLFGTLMIGIVPVVGGLLGLDETTHGLWAGASIHEVAQVVAAAGIIGSAALKVGVIVKLARVLMLAPVIAGINLVQRRRQRVGAGGTGRRPPIVPLFVAGFLAMAIVRTVGVLPPGVLDVLRLAQTVLLAAAMFALGTGVRLAELRAVGGRPVLLGAAATVWVAAIALVGVTQLG